MEKEENLSINYPKKTTNKWSFMGRTIYKPTGLFLLLGVYCCLWCSLGYDTHSGSNLL